MGQAQPIELQSIAEAEPMGHLSGVAGQSKKEPYEYSGKCNGFTAALAALGSSGSNGRHRSLCFGSETNQSHSEGTVGEDLDGIAASSGGENNGFGSGEAREVGICTQEDRCHTADEVGEAEEGGVDSYENPETVMARRYSLTLS
jgi:hypothetical protein